MKIENLSKDAEEFTANAYLIGKKVLIDVGKGEEVRKKITELENIEKILITHSHYDHVDNLQHIVEEHDPEVYAYSQKIKGIETNKLKDKKTVKTGQNTVFEALHTPGHKNDHLCFYNEEEGILFSGDLVFANGGFGRTDLAEGDRDKLIQSIKKVRENCDIKCLYPGHDEPVLENGNKWVKESLENAEKREKKYD